MSRGTDLSEKYNAFIQSPSYGGLTDERKEAYRRAYSEALVKAADLDTAESRAKETSQAPAATPQIAQRQTVEPFQPAKVSVAPTQIASPVANASEPPKSRQIAQTFNRVREQSPTWKGMTPEQQDAYTEKVKSAHRQALDSEGVNPDINARQVEQQELMKHYMPPEADEKMSDGSLGTVGKALGKSIARVPVSLASTIAGGGGMVLDAAGKGVGNLWPAAGEAISGVGTGLVNASNVADAWNQYAFPPEQTTPGTIKDFKDMTPGQIVTMLADQIPEQAASFVLPMVGGARAAKIAQAALKGAPAAGKLGKVLKPVSWLLAGKTPQAAQKMGAFGASALQSYADIGKEQMQETGEITQKTAIPAALAMGKLESLVPASAEWVSTGLKSGTRKAFTEAMKSPVKFLTHFGKEVTKNGLIEGATEFLQEGIQKTALELSKQYPGEDFGKAVAEAKEAIGRRGYAGLVELAENNETVGRLAMATLLGGITGGAFEGAGRTFAGAKYMVSPVRHYDAMIGAKTDEEKKMAAESWRKLKPEQKAEAAREASFRSILELDDAESDDETVKEAFDIIRDLKPEGYAALTKNLAKNDWVPSEKYQERFLQFLSENPDFAEELGRVAGVQVAKTATKVTQEKPYVSLEPESNISGEKQVQKPAAKAQPNVVDLINQITGGQGGEYDSYLQSLENDEPDQATKKASAVGGDLETAPGIINAVEHQESPDELTRLFPPEDLFATGKGQQGEGVAAREIPGKGYAGKKTKIRAGDITTDGEYAIVELDGLQRNQQMGELQNRDRTRDASKAQIESIAANPDPDKLISSDVFANDGPMVVGPDFVVESGNGRTEGLNLAYQKGTAGKYTQALAQRAAEFGIDPQTVSKMKKPVLVRIRAGEIENNNRSAFVAAANAPRQLQRSATEKAITDGQAILDFVGNLETTGSNINTAANQPFLAEFFNRVATPEERGALFTAGGELSQDGLNRVRNAVFSAAYGSPDLLANLTEDTDSEIKSIINGLLEAAPDTAALSGEAKRGGVHQISLITPLAEAAKKIAGLRQQGQKVESYFQQGQFGSDKLNPEARTLLGLFSELGSSKKINDFVRAFNQSVRAHGSPSQMQIPGMESEPPTVRDIMRQAIRKTTPELEAKIERWEAGPPSLGAEFSRKGQRPQQNQVGDQKLLDLLERISQNADPETAQSSNKLVNLINSIGDKAPAQAVENKPVAETGQGPVKYFSQPKTAGTPTGVISREELENTARNIQANLEPTTGVKVVVLETTDDLAKIVKGNVPTDVEGALFNGTAYLVRNNLPDAKRAIEVAGHEIIGHFGLQAILGKEFTGQLVELDKLAETDQQVKAELDRAKKDYFNKKKTDAENRRIALEEALARISEKYAADPDSFSGKARQWFEQAIGKIRDALRVLGFDMEFTAGDLANTIRSTKAAVTREGKFSGKTSPNKTNSLDTYEKVAEADRHFEDAGMGEIWQFSKKAASQTLNKEKFKRKLLKNPLWDILTEEQKQDLLTRTDHLKGGLERRLRKARNEKNSARKQEGTPISALLGKKYPETPYAPFMPDSGEASIEAFEIAKDIISKDSSVKVFRGQLDVKNLKTLNDASESETDANNKFLKNFAMYFKEAVDGISGNNLLVKYGGDEWDSFIVVPQEVTVDDVRRYLMLAHKKAVQHAISMGIKETAENPRAPQPRGLGESLAANYKSGYVTPGIEKLVDDYAKDLWKYLTGRGMGFRIGISEIKLDQSFNESAKEISKQHKAEKEGESLDPRIAEEYRQIISGNVARIRRGEEPIRFSIKKRMAGNVSEGKGSLQEIPAEQRRPGRPSGETGEIRVSGDERVLPSRLEQLIEQIGSALPPRHKETGNKLLDILVSLGEDTPSDDPQYSIKMGSLGKPGFQRMLPVSAGDRDFTRAAGIEPGRGHVYDDDNPLYPTLTNRRRPLAQNPNMSGGAADWVRSMEKQANSRFKNSQRVDYNDPDSLASRREQIIREYGDTGSPETRDELDRIAAALIRLGEDDSPAYSRKSRDGAIESELEKTLRAIKEDGPTAQSKSKLEEVLSLFPDAAPKYSYAGTKANRPKNVGTWEDAKAKLDAGEDPEAVRLKTGWFVNPYDKMPRFEISDQAMSWTSEMVRRFKNDNGVIDQSFLALPDIIDHPELFKAYPGLERVQPRIEINPEAETSGAFVPGIPRTEYSDGQDPDIRIIAPSLDAAKEVLIHEIQHAIQEIEGFAKGGSPKDFLVEEKDKLDVLMERIRILNDEMGKAVGTPEYAELMKARNKLSDQVIEIQKSWSDNGGAYGAAHQKYNALAGEIESRDAADRGELSSKERKLYPPYSTADYAPEEAIVRFSKKTQEDQRKNLYVAHNLSAKALLHASELGGLAMPSIAVGSVDAGPMSNFGEITLLAKPELLESPKTKTFDADIYSPRHPRSKVVVNDKKLNAFIDSLGDTHNFNAPSRHEPPQEASDLSYSTPVRLAWLKEKGIAPELKQKDVPEVYRKLAKFEGHHFELRENPEIKKLIAEHYRKQIQELPFEDKEYLSSRWFNENGEPNQNLVNNLLQEATAWKRDGGWDTYELRKEVDELLKDPQLSAEFEAWSEEKFADMVEGRKLFTGYTAAGKKRFADYTLENVVKEMGKKLKNGENFNYGGAAPIRAAHAKQYKSIEAIQADRDRIVSDADFETIKDESNTKFQELLRELKPFYKFAADGLDYSQDAGKAIAEGERGLREAFDLDDESRQKVRDFVSYLKNLPTEYFEAKIQRAVELGEFETAVVPEGTSPKVVAALEKRGIKIATYKPGDQDDRLRAVRENAVLFSKKGNPQTETPEFKHWFGESKVVDAKGNPLVVYHGTPSADFAIFREESYFTDKPEYAGVYTHPSASSINTKAKRADAPGIIPAYLSIKNPFDTRIPEIRKVFEKEYYGKYGNMTGLQKSGLPDWTEARDLLEWIEETGQPFDGLIVDEGGTPEGGSRGVSWVATKPTQIKSATGNSGAFDPENPDIRFSKGRGDQEFRVYSEMERTLTKPGMLPKKASKADMISAIQKHVGKFKKVELDESGLIEHLQSMQDDSATSQDVADFLDMSRIKVEEKTLSDKSEALTFPPDYDYNHAASRSGLEIVFDSDEKGFVVYDEDGRMIFDTDANEDDHLIVSPTKEEAARRAVISISSHARGREEATKYDTYQTPGGENYRELLLVLPSEKAQNSAMSWKQNRRGLWAWFDNDRQISGAFPSEGDAEEAGRSISRIPKDVFNSGHWEEDNVLLHARFSEREDSDGNRVLFIEEIQSDWHQIGRKRGYKKPGMQERIEQLEAQGREIEAKGREATQEDKQRWADLKNEHQSLVRTMTKGATDAPLKQTDRWAMLGMKRMIQWAVDNGFDLVAWTSGDAQAERYDLSKQISRVTFQDNQSGGIGLARLDGEPTDGTLEAFDKAGKQVISRFVQPNQIEDYIGKEAARKLLERSPRRTQSAGLGVRERELSGIDLKVGGEGMKSFYDNILKNETAKYVKKWGSKVEQTEIRYKKKSLATDPGQQIPFNEALPGDDSTFNAHSFAITPAMRESVAAGQPLYSKKGNAGADPFDPTPEPLPTLTEESKSQASKVYKAVHQVASGLMGKTVSQRDLEDPAFKRSQSFDSEAETDFEIRRKHKINAGMKSKDREDKTILDHLDADKNLIIGMIRKMAPENMPNLRDWLLKKAARVLAPYQAAKPIERILFTVGENITWDGSKVVASPGIRSYNAETGEYEYTPSEHAVAAMHFFNALSPEWKEVMTERAKTNEEYRQNFVNVVIPHLKAQTAIALLARYRQMGADRTALEGAEAEARSMLRALDGKIDQDEHNELKSLLEETVSIPADRINKMVVRMEGIIKQATGELKTPAQLQRALKSLNTNRGHYGYVHHFFESDRAPSQGKAFDAFGRVPHGWVEDVPGTQKIRTGAEGNKRNLLEADIAKEVKEAKAEAANNWMRDIEDQRGLLVEEFEDISDDEMPEGYVGYEGEKPYRRRVVANFGKYRGQEIYLPVKTFDYYKLVKEKGTDDPSMKEFGETITMLDGVANRMNEAMLYHTGKFARDLLSAPFHIVEFVRDWSFTSPTEIPFIIKALTKAVASQASAKTWQKSTPESHGEYSESLPYQNKDGKKSFLTRAGDAIGRLITKDLPVGSTVAAMLKEINLSGAADLPLKRIFESVGEQLAERRGLKGKARERFVYDIINQYAFDTQDLPPWLAWLRGQMPSKESRGAGAIMRLTIPFLGYSSRLAKQMLANPVSKGFIPMAKRLVGKKDADANFLREFSEASRPFAWLFLKSLVASGLGGLLPPEEEGIASDIQNAENLNPLARTHGRILWSQDNDPKGGENWLSVKGLGHLQVADALSSVVAGKSSVSDLSTEFLTMHPAMSWILGSVGVENPYDAKVPKGARAGRMLAQALVPQLTRYGPELGKFFRAAAGNNTIPDAQKQSFFTAFFEQLGIPAGEVKVDRDGKLRTSRTGLEILKQVGINMRHIPYDMIAEAVDSELGMAKYYTDRLQMIQEYRDGDRDTDLSEREFIAQSLQTNKWTKIDDVERDMTKALVDRGQGVLATAAKLRQKGVPVSAKPPKKKKEKGFGGSFGGEKFGGSFGGSSKKSPEAKQEEKASDLEKAIQEIQSKQPKSKSWFDQLADMVKSI